MSYESIRMQAHLCLHDEQYPTSVKKVVSCLLQRMHRDTHSCFPSIKTIMADTGLALRTVKWAIKWARDHGLIEVEVQRRSDNGHTSNNYTVRPCAEWGLPLHSPQCNEAPQPLHSPQCNEVVQTVEPNLNLKSESRFVSLTTEGTTEGTTGIGLPDQDLDLSEVGSPLEPDPFGMFPGEERGVGSVDQARSVITELLEMYPSEQVGASWV